VTGLWRNDGSGWSLLAPSGFPAEAALHDLVEEAPHLLPLSGSPQLAVLGREVVLGAGYADLIAIEPSGRLCVIEVKLASNSEARRAVVAQALSYAAALYGLDVETLERDILADHLRRRGYATIAGLVEGSDQSGDFAGEPFADGLAHSLATGAFRVVLVLDSAPADLVTLVGYLEAVTEQLVIDLVTVSAYDVDGSRILVPQRVEPGRRVSEPPVTRTRQRSADRRVPGADEFRASIDQAAESARPDLQRLHDWATELERDGAARLLTGHDPRGYTLLLAWLLGENVGLVTIWNISSKAQLQLWRGPIERRAPASLAAIEAALAPRQLGQGTTIEEFPDELLAAIGDAYREAAR
jgi:hypothetical protein